MAELPEKTSGLSISGDEISLSRLRPVNWEKKSHRTDSPATKSDMKSSGKEGEREIKGPILQIEMKLCSKKATKLVVQKTSTLES